MSSQGEACQDNHHWHLQAEVQPDLLAACLLQGTEQELEELEEVEEIKDIKEIKGVL